MRRQSLPDAFKTRRLLDKSYTLMCNQSTIELPGFCIGQRRVAIESHKRRGCKKPQQRLLGRTTEKNLSIVLLLKPGIDALVVFVPAQT